jgi:uncharacterized protein YbjT (DUF2867 family)
MGSENSTRQPQAEARVLVLGATGGIGRWTVREAVDGGWSVRALVRKDAALDPGVEVRVGDPLDPPVVAAALEGVTGVVLALGLRRRTESMWAPLVSAPDVVERAARALVTGAGGRPLRVITISAHGVRESWDSLPLLVRAIVRTSKVRFSYVDHAAQERILEDSGLPVLILRPTILADDDSLACVEVADPRSLPLGAKISRRAVARFAVEALRDGRTGIVTLSGSTK